MANRQYGSESRNPAVFAVFGDPVAHSLSPAMHNAAFRSLRLPFVYIRCRVTEAQLPEALAAAAALGWRGVNLTIPLKERAAGLMDRISDEARLVGTVNTVTIREGRLEGHTTDGAGFLRSLQERWGYRPRRARVVLLGAGGAGRAVAFALARARASAIVVLNRTVARSRRLARDVGRAFPVRVVARRLERGTDWRRILADADLLVNATSLGMHREARTAHCLTGIVPASSMHRRLRVADLVYNPAVTPLLRVARSRGLKTMNGEGMLVHQGALAFERWTGRRAPVKVMSRALATSLRALARR